MINTEYTIISPENLQKKENLINRNIETIKKLESIDLVKEYGEDFISQRGITIYDMADMIKKVSKCGTNTVIENNMRIDQYGEIKDNFSIIETCSCNEYTICAVCGSVRRNKIVSNLKPYITVLKQMNGIHTYMATITIKGTENATADYNRLRNSWTSFIKKGQRRKDSAGRSAGESSKIIGSLLSIEVIPEIMDNNKYHVHGHILLVCNAPLEYTIYDQEKKQELQKQYGRNIPPALLDEIVLKKISIPDFNDCKEIEKEIAVSKLSEQWYNSSGSTNFWVKPITETEDKTLESNLYEIVKYSTKPWELNTRQLLDLWAALKGKRTITKAGIFTNNKASKTEFIDLLVKNNLLSLWNILNPGDEIEPAPAPEIDQETEIKVYKNISWMNQKKGIEVNETPIDYGFKKEDEYKDYLRKKILILSEYRTSIHNHFQSFIISTIFEPATSEKKLKWIAEKETIKSEMRGRIKEETNIIKVFINEYQRKKE